MLAANLRTAEQTLEITKPVGLLDFIWGQFDDRVEELWVLGVSKEIEYGSLDLVLNSRGLSYVNQSYFMPQVFEVFSAVFEKDYIAPCRPIAISEFVFHRRSSYFMYNI